MSDALTQAWQDFELALTRYEGSFDGDAGLNHYLQQIKENDPELYSELSTLLEAFYTIETKQGGSIATDEA